MELEQELAAAFALHRAGEMAAAEQAYTSMLSRSPLNGQILYLLGMVSHQQKKNAQAIDALRRAVAAVPASAPLHAALAEVLAEEGNHREAVESYRAALAIGPADALVHFNLGCALKQLDQREAALEAFRQAVALRPEFPEAWNNLGGVFRSAGELDAAADAYHRALSLDPSYAAAHVNLGQVLKSMGRLDEAIGEFDAALGIQPGLVEALSGQIYTLNYHPKADGALVLRESSRWNAIHAAPLAPAPIVHKNKPAPKRRLRIGYVSPDFRDHVAGLYLLPLLREHDRENFEIFCYGSVARADDMTRQFQLMAHAWRDISRVDDSLAAQMIAHDEIDILVDTTLHMGGNRLGVFARKPAPLQVTFCGYPGTTGLQTMDYRLTDPYLDPPGRNDEPYAEKNIRLPHTFWCYLPADGSPHPRRQRPAAKGVVTFGCLNNFCKVNDAVLALWAQVMGPVPASRLLLLSPRGSARSSVLKRMADHRISPDRIEFVEHQPRQEYLRTYDRIDIGLDTFPYNGHTTTLDALWMGVPVITRVGNTAVGRAGLSQLSNIGLPELIAYTDEQFVQIAIGLSSDLDRLQALQQGLRDRMGVSPLMDARGFAAGVEDAYRQMWRQWCDGPRPITPAAVSLECPRRQ